MTVAEFAGNFDIGITVGHGGYVVYGTTRNVDRERVWAVGVFTDIDLALGYVRRVLESLAGPDAGDNVFDESQIRLLPPSQVRSEWSQPDDSDPGSSVK